MLNSLNQYSTVAGQAIGYNLDGNLASDGTFAFAYDPENRLMTAAKTGTSVAYAGACPPAALWADRGTRWASGRPRR